MGWVHGNVQAILDNMGAVPQGVNPPEFLTMTSAE